MQRTMLHFTMPMQGPVARRPRLGQGRGHACRRSALTRPSEVHRFFSAPAAPSPSPTATAAAPGRASAPKSHSCIAILALLCTHRTSGSTSAAAAAPPLLPPGPRLTSNTGPVDSAGVRAAGSDNWGGRMSPGAGRDQCTAEDDADPPPCRSPGWGTGDRHRPGTNDGCMHGKTLGRDHADTPMRPLSWLSAAVCALAMFAPAWSATFLMTHQAGGLSHVLMMASIGHELVARGHTVLLLTPHHDAHVLRAQGTTMTTLVSRGSCRYPCAWPWTCRCCVSHAHAAMKVLGIQAVTSPGPAVPPPPPPPPLCRCFRAPGMTPRPCQLTFCGWQDWDHCPRCEKWRGRRVGRRVQCLPAAFSSEC
jgi:hypothetical protein